MIGDSGLKRSWFVIFDVESEGAFQELDREVVFSDRVKDEADVAVNQGDLRMVLANHNQGEIASTVQKFECSARKQNKLEVNNSLTIMYRIESYQPSKNFYNLVNSDLPL